MQDFKKLKVWGKAHCLTVTLYKVTKTFPGEELFGLTRQMRRCCSSVSANIAEGCGRNGPADMARFLHIAMGSASELEYHLLLARDLDYLTHAVYAELVSEVIEIKRMLTSLIQKLKTEN